VKNFATRFKTAAVRRACAAVFVMLAAAAAAHAQPPSPDAGGRPGVTNPKGDTDARTNREAMLRSAEIGTSGGRMTPQQLAAAIEQTRNDFKRIQLVRNDLVDLLVSKKPFDYKQLAGQAEEISKRAHRLKSFLMKPQPEDEKPPGEKKADDAPPVYDEAALRGALVKLCNTIHSFTGNPMFKNPEVVDAQQPAKAGGELLTIISLSEHVKLNAERMAKAK
jgi:Spy/CpxP family protein refolding chaperone